MTENTHIFELAGGLGNQLFQISAARELVDNPVFDISMLRRPFLNHPMEIRDVLKQDVVVDFANAEGIINWRIKNATLSRIAKISPHGKVGNRIFLRETESSYLKLRESLAKSKKSLRIRGYFQDPQFVSAKQIQRLRSEVPLPIDGQMGRLGLDSSDSFTAVHYRLGDFVVLGQNLPSSYFMRALEALRDNNALNRRVLLFSDALSEAYRELRVAEKRLDVKIQPVETSSPRQMISLFGLANSSVLSNSTLSWWAAKLSENLKMVASPRKWKRKETETQILDSEWLLIES